MGCSYAGYVILCFVFLGDMESICCRDQNCVGHHTVFLCDVPSGDSFGWDYMPWFDLDSSPHTGFDIHRSYYDLCAERVM